MQINKIIEERHQIVFICIITGTYDELTTLNSNQNASNRWHSNQLQFHYGCCQKENANKIQKKKYIYISIHTPFEAKQNITSHRNLLYAFQLENRF